MKNINQSTPISTCRTVCKCVCMDFADVFLTCAAHSIRFAVLLWEAELAFPPLACTNCSLRWIRTRFSPLNSFHKRCRGCCMGEALPSLNVWGYKCLSSCSRNTLPLFRLSGIQVGLILFHITKALYEDTSLMLWKMTRGQRAVILLQL